jgi:F-type H+-transporting ATPase subunit epsilon
VALSLEIVTPKGRALAASAEEVNVPSADGEMGVLPGHLPTLAAVRPGVVSYRAGGGTEWTRCAIGVGFVEISGTPDDKVLVLTSEYTVRETIDPVLVRTDLKAVQAEIAQTESVASDRSTDAGRAAAVKLKQLVEKENWLAAELELYGDPPPPTMRPYEEYGPSGIDETAGGDGSAAGGTSTRGDSQPS